MQTEAESSGNSHEIKLKTESTAEAKSLSSTFSRIISHLRTTPEPDCRRLMLQDTTLETAPLQFELLFGHFKTEQLSQNEVIFLLIYLVALESGFAEKIAYENCESMLHYSYVVTSFFNWHNVYWLVQQKPHINSNSLKTKFSMQLRNTVGDQILSNVALDTTTVCSTMCAVVTGDLMIVSVIPANFDEISQAHGERSVCLIIPRYVVGTVNKKPKELQECLRHMDEFVQKLRNDIFVPIRNYQFSLMELDSFPSLLGLPSDAYDIIFRYLNNKTLGNLANVNKFLNSYIVNSEQFENRKTKTKKPPMSDLGNRSNSIYELDVYY